MSYTATDDPRARILIVDDDSRERELITLILAPDAYRIETAESGQRALAMVMDQPPDLILLDVLMQGTDGYQVAAEIKDNAKSRSIPIILFTALDDREAKIRGLESGAEDFLSKPVDGAELRVRIRNLLRLKAAYEEARHARREAEDANAAKTHFLRVMSHEMRTPLNAIAGYANLLESGARGTLGASQAHDVVRIRTAAEYLTRLIGDVLTAEKFELARPLNRVPVAISPVFAEVQNLCALQAQRRDLRLKVERPDPDILAMADAERFQQILLNLVTNAIKFTPTGGSIDVTAAGDGDHVLVRVSDSGVGIGPADVERVFDPFVQIDRHLADVEDKGIGLGLSISRQLARAMGGDLTLQSTEGVGSVFTLRLRDGRVSARWTDSPAEAQTFELAGSRIHR